MRMMRVRFILVERTTPVRMRPRMETFPVKGHFLSMYVPTHRWCVRVGGGEGEKRRQTRGRGSTGSVGGVVVVRTREKGGLNGSVGSVDLEALKEKREGATRPPRVCLVFADDLSSTHATKETKAREAFRATTTHNPRGGWMGIAPIAFHHSLCRPNPPCHLPATNPVQNPPIPPHGCSDHPVRVTPVGAPLRCVANLTGPIHTACVATRSFYAPKLRRGPSP